MADFKIISYDALPCSLRIFKINGIDADKDDFGESIFTSDGDYGCADAHFEAFTTPPPGVLKKYGITAKYFNIIASRLEEVLHVGACGWCV